MKKILLLCACFFLLAGCTAGPNAESTAPGIAPVAPSVQPAPSKEPIRSEAPSSPPLEAEETPLPNQTTPTVTEAPTLWDGNLETLTLDLFPTELATGNRVAEGTSPLYLVAQHPEQDIGLYGLAGGHGLILRVGEAWQYFDLGYLASGRELPQVGYGDYDEDLDYEVAIQIYSDGGSWGALYDLHIIEMDDGIWTDNWFNPDDYKAILSEMLTSSYDVEYNNVLLVVGDNSVTIDLTALNQTDPGTPVTTYIAPITHFNLNADTINAEFGVGVNSPNISMLSCYVGKLSATVVYTGSAFGLSDFNISAYS